METKELYKKYIDEKRGAWSEASINSESKRLNKAMPYITSDTWALWKWLGENYSKHSRVTIWTRIVAFYDWGIKRGHMQAPNPYSAFREDNPRCFQNFYERKPPGIAFADAKARIMTLSDPEIRNKCLQLLTSGMRWTESGTLTPEGYVIGKGGKLRRVYPMTGLGPMVPTTKYRKVLRALKKIDIKGPHRLRGIFLTELVRRKIDTFDLKEVAGWSSLQTAESYIAANHEKIRSLVGAVHMDAQN